MTEDFAENRPGTDEVYLSACIEYWRVDRFGAEDFQIFTKSDIPCR